MRNLAASLETTPATDPAVEASILATLGRLTHIDDPERVGFYSRALASKTPPRLDGDERSRRMWTMLAWGLGSGGDHDSLERFFAALWDESAARSELLELLSVLDARSRTSPRPSLLAPEIPLAPHARYTRQEVVAALGFARGAKPKVTQGGVLWVPQAQSDVFFVDLRKAERDYSPTTMYRDYAISRELFHWESQSRQAPHQPTVRRYIEHAQQGTNVSSSSGWEQGQCIRFSAGNRTHAEARRRCPRSSGDVPRSMTAEQSESVGYMSASVFRRTRQQIKGPMSRSSDGLRSEAKRARDNPFLFRDTLL